MNRFIRPLYSFLCLSFLIQPILAQNWDWSRRYGGSGNEALSAMEVDASGNHFISGSFSEDFELGATSLETIGASDVFLAKLDQLGVPLWAISGGSTNIDLTKAIDIDSDGNIYWLGEFWIEGFFDTDTLYSVPGSKAAFLLKYDTNGNQLWSQRISGTSSKVINDLAISADNNLYLTGYFKDTLLVQDTFLYAEATEQLFVLKLSNTGDFIWGQRFGEEGTIRGRAIEVGQNGDVILAGQFRGKANFGNQQLESVSTDFDLFVVKLDQDGNPLWAQEGKGIHDDFCNALAIDELDNIFVTGSFIGEMNLGAGLQISTPGFDDNLFLLKYDPQGNPVWARGLDNTVFNEVSVSLDISIQDQMIAMTGYFRDKLIIDNLEILSESGSLNGFLAAFKNTDGNVEWLRRAPCSGQLLSTQVAVNQMDELSIAGAFMGTAFFDEVDLISNGQNDVFVSRFDQMSTPVETLKTNDYQFEIFPNPTTDILNIKTNLKDFELSVYNLLGQKILESRNTKSVKTNILSAGNYWLRVENATFVKMIPFIKF